MLLDGSLFTTVQSDSAHSLFTEKNTETNGTITVLCQVVGEEHRLLVSPKPTSHFRPLKLQIQKPTHL